MIFAKIQTHLIKVYGPVKYYIAVISVVEVFEEDVMIFTSSGQGSTMNVTEGIKLATKCNLSEFHFKFLNKLRSNTWHFPPPYSVLIIVIKFSGMPLLYRAFQMHFGFTLSKVSSKFKKSG